MNIPETHQTVMPYLILDNAGHFLNFVSEVFDATVLSSHERPDGTIMHAEIKIGDSTIMFAQATEQWKPQVAGLFVYVADADACFNKAIAKGAQVVMPLTNQDYGRTCGVTDTTGNTWWITSR
jgi:PhnB protein